MAGADLPTPTTASPQLGTAALAPLQAPPVDRLSALMPALGRAGTLKLSPEEIDLLTEPFPTSAEREYRTKQGRTLRYIPHTDITRRLIQAVGTEWSIVRISEFFSAKENIVYGTYALIVRGCWVGDTVVGWPYRPDNPAMDYADALEADARPGAAQDRREKPGLR